MNEHEVVKSSWGESKERDLRAYLATRGKTFAERHPPYRVRVADQFSWEDDYVLGEYGGLEAAVAAARAITERAIQKSGSVKQWEGLGEVGLVYDGRRTLVWSGLVEYTELPDARS